MASREPIRLTYLINTLGLGGAERGMARLLSGLPADRFDITVIGLATRGGDIVAQLPPEATVIDLELDSPLDMGRLRTVWSVLGRTDVLVTSLYHASQIGRVFGTLRRVPVILSWQHSNRLESATRQRLFGLLSPLDTCVLADSKAAADGAAAYGVDPGRIREVPIAGIDLGNYSPVAHAPRETVAVGTVGRLSTEKNISAVLDVARNTRQDPIEYHVGGEGPLRDELEASAEEYGLDNVTFHGLVHDVPSFLGDMDIYFQPSVREGLCMTVLEAMAAGLPVVASNVGGITETVVPGETGVLEEPTAIDAFTDHIRELSTDADRRERLGRAGRQRVATHYSQERFVDAFLDVLEAV